MTSPQNSTTSGTKVLVVRSMTALHGTWDNLPKSEETFDWVPRRTLSRVQTLTNGREDVSNDPKDQKNASKYKRASSLQVAELSHNGYYGSA